jgi:hypothetical protein
MNEKKFVKSKIWPIRFDLNWDNCKRHQAFKHQSDFRLSLIGLPPFRTQIGLNKNPDQFGYEKHRLVETKQKLYRLVCFLRSNRLS